MIQIDKGVPLPKRPGGQGREPTYPWRELAVGDSFFAAGVTTDKISGCVSSAARRVGRKFSIRTVTESGVKGVRIWRVS